MRKSITFNYLLITFLLAGVSWISLALLCNYKLMKFGQPYFMIIYILGGISPFISALITIRQNSDDYKIFKNEIFKYRLNVLWYIGILILPLMIGGICWLFNLLITGETVLFFNKPVYMVFLFIPVMIIGGGLEEIGWRGVLLPQLLKKVSLLKATLIISIIWALWHVPLWFIPGVSQYGSNYMVFFLTVISSTFLLTTLYIKTRSILICIFLHAINNAYFNIGLNSWATSFKSQFINTVLILAFSITIFLFFCKSNLAEINDNAKCS